MIYLQQALWVWRNPQYVTRHPTGYTQGIRASYAVVRAMREFSDHHKANGTYWCRHCRKRPEKGLHVHHVEPVSVAPEKADDEENFILLCQRCHFTAGHLNNWKSFDAAIVNKCLAVNRVESQGRELIEISPFSVRKKTP